MNAAAQLKNSEQWCSKSVQLCVMTKYLHQITLHYTIPVFYCSFYRSMFYGEVLYPPSSWTRCRVAIQRHLELLMIVNRYTRVITNLAKKN